MFGLFESNIHKIEREARLRSGGPPVPAGLMPESPGPFPPGSGAFQSDGGAGAHALVDKLLNTPKEPTVEDAWRTILLVIEGDAEGNIDLIREVIDLRARIAERLAEQTDARLSALRAEQERLYGDCRAALDRVQALQRDQGAIQMKLNGMAADVAGARSALRAAENSRPDPRGYPTAAEMAEWQEAVTKARSEADHWERQNAAAESELAACSQRIERAYAEFRRLHVSELRLRDRITAGAPVDNIKTIPPETFLTGGRQG